MIRVELAPADLLRLRFAHSPTAEVVASCLALRSRSARLVPALWRARAEPAALAALLGSTRAAMLALLAEPSSMGEVAAALRLAPATASHHLTTLRDAGLVSGEREGRRLRYRRTGLGEQLAGESRAP
ncbi:helix-turn-helix transcriptional regulator [Microbispora sp. H13382]|uniref:ArsR/SmtB family transcription factor n=1 Tax=Microbispora sp. H13382 TaxID=2729112 RepID=UPI001601CC5F|nr:metalloregulator ArsR/SmtB family transcription factor [Microbispora sp. H13382]